MIYVEQHRQLMLKVGIIQFTKLEILDHLFQVNSKTSLKKCAKEEHKGAHIFISNYFQHIRKPSSAGLSCNMLSDVFKVSIIKSPNYS